VGLSKATNSQVAGAQPCLCSTDLNTGNTSTKQCSEAPTWSAWPIAAGLNKPVNDLSRGALVEDIVFTIAITAVQAKAAVATRRQQKR